MLHRNDGVLHVEQVPLTDIAEQVGTPTYVYSRAYLTSQYQRLQSAFAELPSQICYAVKANSNLAILKLFMEQGAGFDIVSGGELERLLYIGADPSVVVFSGVGKRVDEIDLAIKSGVGCINVESRQELERIADRAAALRRRARVSLRVNPDIDAKTHPYISTGLKDNKFGIPIDEAIPLYRLAADAEFLDIVGIDCHIGSQIAELDPMLEACDRLVRLADDLQGEGIVIQHLDLGGGFGVHYQNENEFDVARYGAALRDRLAGRDLSVKFEPGRFLVANGGCLLTRVEYTKPANTDDAKSFAVVDAAMNDLIRPALYQAYHDIQVVATTDTPSRVWEIVGPVCESGDFLGNARALPIQQNDLLAVGSAGAYGFAQASNYNSRARAAEVLVDGDEFATIRRREHTRDWLAPELDCLEADA